MFGLWWIGVKYVAGGSSFLGAMCNCYVHVLMYSYYFLAACGPSVRKWLWWKKYLTLIQIVQFVFALVMGLNAIRVGCDFPLWMQYSANAYMFSFLVLFGRFWHQEYGAIKAKKCRWYQNWCIRPRHTASNLRAIVIVSLVLTEIKKNMHSFNT